MPSERDSVTIYRGLETTERKEEKRKRKKMMIYQVKSQLLHYAAMSLLIKRNKIPSCWATHICVGGMKVGHGALLRYQATTVPTVGNGSVFGLEIT